MRKYKNNYSCLIILLTLFSNFIILPFITVQFTDYNNYTQSYSTVINTDSLTNSLRTQITNNDQYFNSNNNDMLSKYDDDLKIYLTTLNKNQVENQQSVKIIILFEDSVRKEKRIEILDDLFVNYTLLSNYDIISGTYLKIDPSQLISHEGLINGIKEIKSIYKSQIYKNPYILDNKLETSALNSVDYPNWWTSAIGADNLEYDGTGVKVAVIDTGVYDHPDLNIINNSNFVTDENTSDYNDDVGHGTHVAGIIASDGGLSGEYAGVAPGALIINARAGNASGLLEGDIVKAIEWSSKPIKSGGAGADIISMSFGGGYPIISDIITQAISNAKKNYDVIFVASAGNSGPDYFTGSTPASGIDVISVGATNKDDELASFSSWGPTFRYLGYPDVVAPGVNIISTEAKNSIISKEERLIGDYFDFTGDADYIPLSGTSMSCPMVSGALAILLDAFPNITPETARIALLNGSKTLMYDKDGSNLKSGAGLINVTASLNYLNAITPNINDIAKINPSELPVDPFDLLNFPGDHQKFNLTLLSGKDNTFDIEVPNNIQGVKLSIDKSTVVFTQSGIEFLELDIEIKKDAIPGIRNFQINLTIGAQIYDKVQISLKIKLPESRILMESYHGLNDWFPNITGYNDIKFYQLGFYEVIQDLSEMNISVDYYMEHWTPDYNKDFNNSILTEERLAQYDAVILQTPILPYSALEIENINNYFQNGGNLLFLGTKYQYMALDNINYLFSKLNVSIQLNEENIMDVNWLGLGATVDSQNVSSLNNNEIFMDVNKFYWIYGNTFTVSNDAESIASINGKTVVAMYNGTSQNKGNLLAFGDLHWMYTNYDSSSYEQDHLNLLKNVIDFLLPTEEVAITIDLQEESYSKSTIDLSIYLKNQTTNSPITTYDSLNVVIENSPFSSSIILNTTTSDKGIYFNYTFQIPFTSYSPYTIELNLTIGSKVYSKTTKILYFDPSEMPKIESLTSSDDAISRSITANTNLIAELDDPSYGIINGYMSIYTYSFYNTKKTVNKTLTFTHSASNNYISNFNPDTNDPSGYAIYYITPTNSNYTNPKSPRYLFEIVNYAPEIVKTTSTFNFGGYADILFDDTESDQGSFVYSTSQGEIFNFKVDVEDGVSFEDQNSDMRLFVNFLTCSVTEDGYIIPIFPLTLEVVELQFSLGNFEGSFTIPYTMVYSSISENVSRSTAANFNVDTKQGYLSILYLTLYDSEGGTDDFIIILMIAAPPADYSFIVIVVISIIALIGVVGLFVYFARRKRYPKKTKYQPTFEEYTYQPYYEEKEEGYITPKTGPPLGPSVYCPFCGGFISTPKKFCPHCGESLEFLQE